MSDVSLHITGEPGKYRLMERNYFAQGCKPDYTDICQICDAEAASLAASGLIDPWFAEISGADTADPADCLSFEIGAHGRNVVMLRLGACPPRRGAIEMEVPGLGHNLREATRDPDKLRAFLDRAGIAVAGMKPAPATA